MLIVYDNIYFKLFFIYSNWDSRNENCKGYAKGESISSGYIYYNMWRKCLYLLLFDSLAFISHSLLRIMTEEPFAWYMSLLWEGRELMLTK